MDIQWLLDNMRGFGDREAVILDSRTITYDELCADVGNWSRKLTDWEIESGEIVAIEGDYSPEVCAALLALIDNGNIIVPLSLYSEPKRREFLSIAEVQTAVRIRGGDIQFERFDHPVEHPMLMELLASKQAGLILFTSGSTGMPKAIVHDLDKMLERYRTRRDTLRTISFLLFDHIGGMNTLLHTLSNGGTLICPKSRNPYDICKAIESHHVELLPTTPSFLNLLLISESFQQFDFSSLKIITYGTEVMHEYTLSELCRKFPGVQFRQTYGLSELGIMRVKSKSSDSLWMKVGGEGVETKIVNATLHIKSANAMKGYLNAPNLLDDEGWFNTQDQVITDGEYIRILGRQSEMINVGGNKVSPSEVENVLLQMSEIKDVSVKGLPNALLGYVVTASVNVYDDELNAKELKQRIRRFCQGKLETYKVPVQIFIQHDELHSDRFKKIRK